jgi:hypothetical protein
MARYFVNAPSTLQVDHPFNGRPVLAPARLSDLAGTMVTCYFLDAGPEISARLYKISLSPGS